MQTQSYDNIVIKILVSPKLRILRHIILFVFSLAISAGMIWFALDRIDVNISSFEKYGVLLFYSVVLLSGCYFNIYVLTPKLLLKNKWGIHFCSLFALAQIVFGIILVVQINMVSMIGSTHISFETENEGYLHFLTGILNILSSALSLFFLFTGISTLVLFKYWIQDKQQSEELESTTLQLELKMLENQINPHFLFNMLNNANIMIEKDPDMALHIVRKLEEMLRYQFNESTQKKVYLKDEIVFLNDFLELEKTRRDYFSYTVSEEGELDDVQIPPLLFITFAENAVKHNQDSRTASYVNILFKVLEGKLIFVCENSIPQRGSNKEVGGIGLTNIERRLNLLFKDNYSLEQTKTDTSYTVKLELKL